VLSREPGHGPHPGGETLGDLEINPFEIADLLSEGFPVESANKNKYGYG